MIKGVLFDFRDTLINVKTANGATVKAAWQLVKKIKPGLKQVDFKRDYQAAYQTSKSQHLADPSIHNWTKVILSTYLASQNLKLRPLELSRWLNKLDQVFIKHCHLFPDAQTILTWLKKKKIKLGVIIDGTSHRERAIIHRLKLVPYFTATIISQEVGKNKFTRYPLEAGIKKLGLPAKQIIVVGDRLDKDICWANKLGAVSILLQRQHGRYNKLQARSNFEIPQHTIKNLTELKKIIKL